MHFLRFLCVPVFAWLATNIPAQAQSDQEQGLTSAFLDSCSALVNNSGQALAMDLKCVTYGRELCNADRGLASPVFCLRETVDWLHADARAVWKKIDGQDGNPFDSIPTIDDVARVSGRIQPKFDCQKMDVPRVPKSLLCEYGEATIVWSILRDVRRAIDSPPYSFEDE